MKRFGILLLLAGFLLVSVAAFNALGAEGYQCDSDAQCSSGVCHVQNGWGRCVPQAEQAHE